jgi:hypothetical protein
LSRHIPSDGTASWVSIVHIPHHVASLISLAEQHLTVEINFHFLFSFRYPLTAQRDTIKFDFNTA